MREICFCFFGVFGCGDHCCCHAKDVFDVFVGCLGEDDVLFDAERVVAHRVDAACANAFKVFGARERDVDEAIKKILHVLAAERNLVAHLVADAGFW